MEARPRIIRTYETEDGKVPFNEWLEKLRDRQVRSLIRTRINRLRLGLFGDCKAVGNGVSELRISFGAGYRLYFGQESNEIIILLCGGDKSSQTQDIAKAKEYWQDYRRRGDG